MVWEGIDESTTSTTITPLTILDDDGGIIDIDGLKRPLVAYVTMGDEADT